MMGADAQPYSRVIVIRVKKMRSLFLVLCVVATLVCADVVEKIAQQAEDTVNKANAGTIRQCTCDEQHECVTELEAHGQTCMDDCFGKFNKITKHPEQLRECFHTAQITIGSLITCFEDEATMCAQTKTDKQVKRVDIKKLLDVGTSKLLTVEKNLTSLFAGEVKQVLDVLTDYGVCVKDCVVQKNSGGFCFDKKGCHPLLDDKTEAKKAAKKCAKQVDFKKHAGEICECAKKAGVENISKFCPILKNASEGVQDAVKGSH